MILHWLIDSLTIISTKRTRNDQKETYWGTLFLTHYQPSVLQGTRFSSKMLVLLYALVDYESSWVDHPEFPNTQCFMSFIIFFTANPWPHWDPFSPAQFDQPSYSASNPGPVNLLGFFSKGVLPIDIRADKVISIPLQ